MTDADCWRSDLYDLVVTGFHAVDTGMSDREAPPTTEDFALTLPGTVIAGERYAEFLRRRAKADYTTRHCVSNFRMVERTAGSATVGFVVSAHRLNAGETVPVVTVADFVDEWVQVDGAWRQRSRAITPAFPVGS
jgi:hypothetical protein